VDPSESTHHTSKWAATVRQQIQDLEGPGFQYKAMFGAETRAQVNQHKTRHFIRTDFKPVEAHTNFLL